MLGGVLAGIAAAHGLDLKLARVVVGLGAFLLPPVVPLYVAAWILLPREPEAGRAPADLLRGGGRTWVVVGLGFLAFLAFMDGGWAHGPGRGGNLLGAALLLGLGAWLWSQRSTPPPVGPAGTSPASGPTRSGPSTPPWTGPDGPPAPGAPGGPRSDPGGGGTAWPGSSIHPTGAAAGPTGSGTEPWVPVPPRLEGTTTTLGPSSPSRPPGPPVGRVTMALGLIALGAVVAGDRFGWYRLDVAAALAVLLGVVGLGLVIGAFVGGGRGLIAPAIVLLLLTVAAAAVGRVHLDGAIGERTIRPATVAEAAEQHDHGIGKLTVDLRQLAPALPPDETVTVPVDLGIGELRVLVPEGVDLEVAADVGAGRIDALDRGADGLGNDELFRFDDPDSDRRLRLDLDVGIGHVDVDTVAEPQGPGTR